MSRLLVPGHRAPALSTGPSVLPLAIGVSLLVLFGMLTAIALRDHLFVPATDEAIGRFCEWAVPASLADIYAAVAEIGSVIATAAFTALLAVVLVGRGRWRSAALAIAAMAAVLLIEAVIRIHPGHLPQSPADLANLLLGRGGWSETYPSGHTARIGLVGVLYPALVARRVHPRWLIAAVILAALIGVQRVHAGLHSGDEVIGGALLGWGVASIALAVAPLLHDEEEPLRDHVEAG